MAVGVRSLGARLRRRIGAGETAASEPAEPTGHEDRVPAVSVVVPFYGVEAYLAECLDSVLAQTFTDFECLLVDDGSPDGSRAIADEYAARDSRLRVVVRENGGLGAARNTGIDLARGEFLTFADSDDILPPDALATLVHSARESGSDVVVGSLERFDSGRTWQPGWVAGVHDRPRIATTAAAFPQVLRNLYTWNKLWRRDFWDAHGLRFREGVAYEDQPLVTQLLVRAGSVDVLPDVVYRWRRREDGSSISQAVDTVRDLRDRIGAWEASREAFATDLSPELYDAWLGTLVDAHFLWYLGSDSVATDDVYWTELHEAVVGLMEGASPRVWEWAAPAKRVLVNLARLGRRRDVVDFVAARGTNPGEWPTEVVPEGLRVTLPLPPGDPAVEAGLDVLAADSVSAVHLLEHLRWEHGDAGPVLVLSGWAHLRLVDLTGGVDQRVVVELRPLGGGPPTRVHTEPGPMPVSEPPFDDVAHDYLAGHFEARVPLADLDLADGAAWRVWLGVRAAGLSATTPLVLGEPDARRVHGHRLADGRRLLAEWDWSLTLRVDSRAVPATTARLDHRTVRVACDPGAVSELRLVEQGGGGVVASATPEADGVVVLDVPPARPGARPRRLTAVRADGSHVGVVAPESLGDDAASPHLHATPAGLLVVREWGRAVLVDEVDVDHVDRTLRVAGRLVGDADSLALGLRHRRADARGESVAVHDGAFVATVPLVSPVPLFGLRPLAAGHHDLVATVEPGGAEVPVLATGALAARLPARLPDTSPGRWHDLALVRGGQDRLRLWVRSPLGADRARAARRRLAAAARTDETDRGLLVCSRSGRDTEDAQELARALTDRDVDLPLHVAVADHGLPVPPGATPVLVHSPEWFALLARVSHYVGDEVFGEEVRPDRLASYRLAAAPGAGSGDAGVLACGLPRHDRLVGAPSRDRREEVRDALGVGSRRVVLLGPVVTVDDLAMLRSGDDAPVLLMRGGPRSAAGEGVLDVAAWPWRTDLVLAADLVVADDPVLCLDAVAADRPVVLLAAAAAGLDPDELPGPAVATVAALAPLLSAAPPAGHDDARARYRRTHLPMLDGGAAARVVSAVLEEE